MYCLIHFLAYYSELGSSPTKLNSETRKEIEYMINKFDPYAISAEEKRTLTQMFVMTCNLHSEAKIYTTIELRVIWSILIIAGFDVQTITSLEVKCDDVMTNRKIYLIITTLYFGKIRQDEKATRWLNDLFEFTRKEIRTSTMMNIDRITGEVLAKLELCSPMVPIPLLVGWGQPRCHHGDAGIRESRTRVPMVR